jgi:putative ATP-dependent endonuclease of OLD family
MPISDNTVLIGENNSGKTAVLDALRIALPQRMSSRDNPFDEYDYHMVKRDDSPQSSAGIVIELWFREDKSDEWPDTLVQALTDIIQTEPSMDLDSIGLRVTSKTDDMANGIVTKWEFLNLEGQPLGGKGADPRNLSKLLSYVRCFYLSSLRDSSQEFSPRSQFWGRILRDLKISDEQKREFTDTLAKINDSLLKADPRLEKVRATLEKSQQISELGSAQMTSIQALPIKPWDLMSKAEVIVKSRGGEIDFPLSRHGQGMQSLAVLFLFQAYIDILLKPSFEPQTEAILALEEPEAHLHPQATRMLAAHLGEINSQKILSSHSPYFIQDIPLRQIRMFRRKGPSSKVLWLKRSFSVALPNKPETIQFCEKYPKFKYSNGALIVHGKLEEDEYRELLRIYSENKELHSDLKQLKTESESYLDDSEIGALETYAKRIRGEVLFARGWLLCEGQSDYLLIRYFAELLGVPLDQAGVSVIDFQNNGSPGAFAGLARTFDIPWIMVCDNDDEGKRFVEQVRKRGLTAEEASKIARPLPEDNADMELFLIKNGFDEEYLAIVRDAGGSLDIQKGEEGFEDALASKIRKDKLHHATALIDKLRASKVDKARVPVFFDEAIRDIIARVK